MLEQAQAELPNECCGLFAGRIENGIGRVEVRYPLVNELASPREYNAEAKGLLAAHKNMRSRSLVELARYHSHPTTEPVPSRTDLTRNYFGEEVVFLIIGMNGPEPIVRGWWLAESDYSEATWDIID
jgi:proteasome lid subunit RPN8/RPN11